MSRVIDCQPFHLLHVAFRLPQRDVDEALALGFKSVQDVAVRRAADPGVKFTVIDAAGTPQVCFGVAETMVPGVGVLWMLRAKGAEPFVKTGAKAVRAIVASGEYRRIETQARADCGPCRTFIEWLGFTFEGTKRGFFTDGCDLHQFAIVR